MGSLLRYTNRPGRDRGWPLAVLGLALYVAGLVSLMESPTGYALLVPGPAPDTLRMLPPPAEGLSGRGHLFTVTVGTIPRTKVRNLIYASFIPAASAVPSQRLLPPDATLQGFDAHGRREMEESKAAALRAVLDFAGVSASEGGLVEFPSLDTGDLIGPSAGLMMALAIVDRLSEAPLTGGHAIAGTGTIASGGEVGAVGGLVQKVASAEHAGAEYFLVPPGNYEEAVRAASTVRVVPVASLAEAVEFLRGLAPVGEGGSRG